MQVDWPYEFPGAYWLDEQEASAVQDVLQHGSLFRYYGLGAPRYVDALEESARCYFDKKYALALNSGTGALMGAMSALDIGPGCEVIVPAFLWVATVAAVVQQNAIPVLCEVDESFCLDPSDLERRITPNTRLIVPIHMIGSPCDMGRIMEIAVRSGIPVLEDTAQCIGGSYRGRKLGTFGKAGVFSFQLNKNITCGEGGLLVTDDERLYHKAFSSHDMGMIRVDGRLAMPGPEAVAWGAGRRMPELCGAVASVQMQKLDQIIAAMRASKKRIKEMVRDVPGLSFRMTNDPDGDTGAFMTLSCESELQAVAVAKHLKQCGLHNAIHIADYGLHVYYRIPGLVGKVPLSSAGNPWSLSANARSVYSYEKGACPASDALLARSVLLPIPSRLSEQQEAGAAAAIREAFGAAPGLSQPHYRSQVFSRG